jgi:WD40 repeat protein
LNVPSEKISEEEVEQDGEEEQKQQTLQNDLKILGRFHTAQVNDVQPLGRTTQMVSCSSDNTVAIWEVTTMQQLAVIEMPVEPISLSATKEGSVIFIGTAIGTFRCYDVTNRERPKLIHQLKFYEDEKPISSLRASEDGKLVVISSKESDTFFVMSQEASTGFDIFGQIKASGHVLSIDYYKH